MTTDDRPQCPLELDINSRLDTRPPGAVLICLCPKNQNSKPSLPTVWGEVKRLFIQSREREREGERERERERERQRETERKRDRGSDRVRETIRDTERLI